jgi:hypothetical protein
MVHDLLPVHLSWPPMTGGDPQPPGSAGSRDGLTGDERPIGAAGPGDRPIASGGDLNKAAPSVLPGPPSEAAAGVTRAPRRSRARAALISALFGGVLVVVGLYLVGAFGARLYDAATNTWVASTSDLVLAVAGAICLLAAVLLNGWSPWATALPGVILTGVGVWSVVSVDGAGRVATFVDDAVGRGDLILSGVHILVLVIGLLLLGASGAVTIARSAGRSRGRA